MIDRTKACTVTHAQHVSNFGDGYRQVTGDQVGTGTVAEMLELVSERPPAAQAAMYFSVEGERGPYTYLEVLDLIGT